MGFAQAPKAPDMDNEYRLDFSEIMRTIRDAEVILFRFVTVPQRMLLDYRRNEIDGPMIKLVPRATSPEDRFKSVKMLRPRFRLPQKISAVWWPRHVERLVEDGVWGAIVQRMIEAGYPAVAAEASDVLEELRRMEREELANAIGGDGYRTLWPVTSG
jgi:hypothetical protein